jgi:predicted nucleotide-binding protein
LEKDEYPDPLMVFIVFRQQNNHAKEVMDDFLRTLGLRPHDISEVVEYLKQEEEDTIGNLLKAAFRTARGFMVLLTPDEEVRLRDEWVEDENEDNPSIFQPRPNVMLEAGMALGKDESRTILVKIGRPNEPFRLPTDLDGRYYAELGTAKSRNKRGLITVKTKLKRAGCELSTEMSDTELDEYCERFAITISSPREPWQASKKQRKQGLDYKRIPLQGKLLRSLSFKVKSESPYWRAGFFLEEQNPPEEFEKDFSIVHEKSLLFHVGRDEDGAYRVTAYHDQVSGTPPLVHEVFRANDGDEISISLTYDGKTKIRCAVNDKEYSTPSFENINPELLKKLYLMAWGDFTEAGLREYTVAFADIEAIAIY